MVSINVQKRSGLLESFDREKIHRSIVSAMEATVKEGLTTKDDLLISEMVEAVFSLIQKEYPDSGMCITYEAISSIIERVLVDHGEFEVAKKYIIYRAEQERKKSEERVAELQKIDRNATKVIKSNGRKQMFSTEKVKHYLALLAEGLEGFDLAAVTEEIKGVQIIIKSATHIQHRT